MAYLDKIKLVNGGRMPMAVQKPLKIARVSLYLQKTYQGNYQKPLKIKTNFLMMLINMALMRLQI